MTRWKSAGAWTGAGLAGLLTAAAAGAVLGPPPCGDGGSPLQGDLPIVLRVGLPLDSELAGMDREGLSERVVQLFDRVYQAHGICSGKRRLQVNLALGNDYQIVDWLAQRKIDVGVTSDVGIFLLTRVDRQSLVELDLFQSSQILLQLPRLRQTLRSYRVAAGRVEPRDDPRGDFTALLSRLWAEAEGEAGAREGLEACRTGAASGDPARKTGLRLEVPSHLSTSAFAALLGEAGLWLERQRPRADGAPAAGREEARRAREDRFWDLLLERTAFTLSRRPPPPSPAREGVVIQAGEEISPSEGYRSHLVLPAQVAANLLQPGSFRDATYELPPGAETLLAGCSPEDPAGADRNAAPPAAGAEDGACRVPAPLKRWLRTDPYFGVRPYGFTLEESLALLRQHQRSAAGSAAKLALVLPGGGVKAVYQSRLIDELYGGGLLRNALDADPGGSGLSVDAVIGTSGGALLGYFVARLPAQGPFDLSRILWNKDSGETLDSSDIFDWGDLLRYTSAVAIFLVFSLCLAFFSFQTARFARSLEGAVYPATRLRLALALWPPLALAPLLVGWVNGSASPEHIPASEGLFFLICTTIALFADQCFIVRPGAPDAPDAPNAPVAPDAPETGGGPLHPLLLLLPGALLVALPLLPSLRAKTGESWSEQDLLFLGAFGPILVLTVGIGFLLPVFRQRGWPASPRGRLLVSLAELAGAFLLGLLALALPPAVWKQLGKVPFFLAGFLLLFFLFWFGPSSRRRAGREQGLHLKSHYAGLATATLLIVLLCAPRDLQPGGCAAWFRKSGLDLSLGAFLVCLGVLLFLGGTLLWVARAKEYRVEEAREFRSALGLSLFLVALVNVILFALSGLGRLRPFAALRRFSFLELTREFWLWLGGVSFAVSVVVIVAAAILEQRKPRHRLIRGLRFLCGSHPNGIFFNRRFVRVALLGAGALGWWNFVIAPALYGNRPAKAFLQGAVSRFENGARGGDPKAPPPPLRTQFLTPANVLERDGTRYFLVLPPGAEECQPIFQPPGSGAVWNQFTVQEPGGAGAARASGCDKAFAWPPEQIQEVIFASGSPFPIFPAHWVAIPKEGESRQVERVALVDGGYSNNEPIDAAVGIGSSQVLVVRSSSVESGEGTASPGGPPEGELLRRLHGPLVGNLSRLAGFLYERAQQQDRLSRRDVFVVALSPRPRAGWPELFDFRQEVVEGLRACAQEDRYRRIGAVESWGPPRFQLSIEVRPERR